MTIFREDPVNNAVYNGMRRGIEVAIEGNCFGSAVILIFSAIDTMAYISMPADQEDVTKTDFINWAGRYIRFSGPEQLTAMELYGARCAMLHSYGVRSRMTRTGKCRMIGYMSESHPAIRFRPDVSKEFVLVSVPALKAALFQGIDRSTSTRRRPRSRPN